MTKDRARNKLWERWYPWAFWSFTMALITCSSLLIILYQGQLTASVEGATALRELLLWNIIIPLSAPVYAVVGLIITVRTGGNRVGWMCMAIGLLFAAQQTSWFYATLAMELAPGSLPEGPLLFVMALAGSVLWCFQFPLSHTILLLIFPTGHFLSPRWRLVGWLALLYPSAQALTIALAPTIEVGLHTALPNPLGLPIMEGAGNFVAMGGSWVNMTVLAVAATSLVARWWRSEYRERQQLKWLCYMAALTALTGFLFLISSRIAQADYPSVLLEAIYTAGASIGIPIAIGIALVRYRLYDIDVLIHRTLSYGALSTLLLGIYAGCIILLQYTLQIFLLNQQSSDLAVATSTLALVVLFHPMRVRVQSWIDRRFYRQKFDAAQMLTTFHASLRDEVDLERLQKQLVEVVEGSMQPTHISLWLRSRASSKATRSG